ncbi:hypothetical protein AYO20_09998 [Fonsecaea nubica]|uniref:Uncharacterized protein n=1 Tax=Fonsecaea nubica TaxID=856822 RepID=A0A178CAT7_9EURO|nr:hypothetical protein AYO20_09998 [Fonsecaea nubica]OAL26657.1 hypothetical protein AYO20_09998 [Fonsecaea nubica]
MVGLRKKARGMLREISSPSLAPAPLRLSSSKTEPSDKSEVTDKKAATLATPSTIAESSPISPLSRTTTSAKGKKNAAENENVRSLTEPPLVPDHDPAASQSSESKASTKSQRAELDPFGDGNRLSQSATTIHELGDTSSSTKTSESRGGLFRLPISIGYSKPTTADPAELPGDQPKPAYTKPTYKPAGPSEVDAMGDRTQCQADGQSSTGASRSTRAADDELYRLEKEIRRAAQGMVNDSDLDAAFKKRGTSGALKLLVETYEPLLAAEKDLNDLEDKIRAAMKGHVRTMEVNAEIRKRGTAGGLQLLLDQCQSALKAEQALRRVEESLRSANHDVRMTDLNSAHKAGGAEAMLALVVDDYQVKKSASLVLERVAGQIRKASPQTARKEVDNALKSREAGVESALGILVGAYQPYADAYKELTNIEGELRRAARETSWSQNVDIVLKKSGPEGALRLLIEHLQAKTEALRKMEGQYSGLEQSWKKLTGECHNLRQEQARHQTQMAELKSSHQARMIDVEKTWKSTLEKQQRDAASQAQMVEQRHRGELDSRDTMHRNEIASWRATMQSAKEKHESEQKKLKDALLDTEQQIQLELDRLREEFETKEKESRKREMERIEQFRLETEELKGELVKRDHFKGLSDPEICTRFKKLAQEVNSFARIQWEKKREGRWPVQEHALRRSENPRKLKQQLVQGGIWMILRDKIFHSPFGVLGDEGQRIHGEWTSEFGEDPGSEMPHWPEATEESETWRFERIKEYWDAAKRPDSDASIRLKPAYDQRVTVTVDEIRNAVEAIATLSPHDLQLIREFVELAASFWLDVMAQKCRVYLIFPAQGTNPLVQRKPSTATLDLVIQPEVRRRGNAQGQRFAREQVVKGCEGQTTNY